MFNKYDANGIKVEDVVVTSSALPTGASTSANQTNGTQQTKITDGSQINTLKRLDVQVAAADIGMVTNTVMHGLTSAGGGGYVDVKVTPSGALVTAGGVSGTATNSSVADNAASTTVLAANTSRLGASITNDSSAALYLLLGTGTASTTNYTARIVQYGYYETPYGYTGIIKGIWASDPNDGAAQVTEFT